MAPRCYMSSLADGSQMFEDYDGLINHSQLIAQLSNDLFRFHTPRCNVDPYFSPHLYDNSSNALFTTRGSASSPSAIPSTQSAGIGNILFAPSISKHFTDSATARSDSRPGF